MHPKIHQHIERNDDGGSSHELFIFKLSVASPDPQYGGAKTWPNTKSYTRPQKFILQTYCKRERKMSGGYGIELFLWKRIICYMIIKLNER